MNYDCSVLINNEYQILDVTLRDGGHRNQWRLSQEELIQMTLFLASLPVNIIEVGYISDQGKYGCNGTLDAEVLSLIRKLLPADKQIAVMLFEGEPDSLKCLASRVEFIDLLRLTTNGKDIDKLKAIVKFCQAAQLDYTINVTKISAYNEKQLLKLMPTLHALSAKVIYFADSYGAMYPQAVYSLINAAKKAFPKQAFGFHAHDNLSLAFMNSAAAIAAGATYLDCSLCGMGMGAGNLTTEHLLFYVHHQSENFQRLINNISNNLQLYELMGLAHDRLKYLLSGILNIAQENASMAKDLQAILDIMK